METSTKFCTKCLATKQTILFFKNRSAKDGLNCWCKSCIIAASAKWASENRATYRAQKRRNQQSKTKRGIKQPGGHSPVSPERLKIKNMVSNAVRDGKLIKPSHCQRCNATGRLHGHHSDYSKPLAVEWICPKCHGFEHRKPIAQGGKE